MAPKRSRRKFLTSTGAVALGMTVAGCTGGSGGGVDGDGLDIEPPGDFEVQEDVEIDFWYSIGGEKGEVVQGMASDFNEMSDSITVNAVHEGSYGDVWNSMLQGIRADDPPAVAHLNAVHTLQAWGEDAIIPVEQVLGDAMDHDDFIEAAGNYYVIDDELQGLPFAMSTVTAHYNVDAFEEAGLETDPESVPMDTFDDYRETSQALIDAGATSRGATWPNHNWFYESWFANLGQNFVNNDNGRSAPATESHLDSEASQRLFNWMIDMYDAGEMLHSEGWGDARQAYINEEVGILLDSSSNIAEMTEGAEEAGFESRVGTVPAYDEWHGLVIGGGSLFVPNGVSDAELEAASEFLLWMAEPEQQAHFHSNTGYYPTSHEATNILEEEGFYEENPGFLRAYQQLAETENSTATAGPLMMDHGQVRDAVTEGMTRMLQGTPVEEGLESTKSEVDDIIAAAAEKDPRS